MLSRIAVFFCVALFAAGASSAFSQGVAPTISYSPKKYTLFVGDVIPAITPALAGVVDSVTITPGLPLHLMIDPATGEISGSPDAAASGVTYIVRAYNGNGISGDTITIAAIDTSFEPPIISYSPKKYTLKVGDMIPMITPFLAGSVDSVTITPGLPLHLMIDPTTGEISGSPDDTSAGVPYIVRAYNSNGVSADTITIAVTDSDLTKIRRASGGTNFGFMGMDKIRPSLIRFSVPWKNGLREIRFTLYDLAGKVKWSGRIGSGQISFGCNSIDIARVSRGVYCVEMRVFYDRGAPIVQKARVTVIQ